MHIQLRIPLLQNVSITPSNSHQLLQPLNARVELLIKYLIFSIKALFSY